MRLKEKINHIRTIAKQKDEENTKYYNNHQNQYISLKHNSEILMVFDFPIKNYFYIFHPRNIPHHKI